MSITSNEVLSFAELVANEWEKRFKGDDHGRRLLSKRRLYYLLLGQIRRPMCGDQFEVFYEKSGFQPEGKAC